MATSAEDSSIIEEELTCAVCLELYRDPHLLPCGHNFCLQCLQKLKSPSDHGRLRCPECRQSHRIYINYPKNLKLANIADGFRRRAQSERSTQSRSDPSHKPAEVLCDYCPGDGSEDGKGPMAVKTCLKCEVSMCPIHVQPHLELPAFREHPLVEPLNDMRKRKCLEHDEMFQYYCIDEGLFLCNACTIEGKHNGHNIKTLKNTMKDFKVNLDVKLHKTTRKILRAERNLLEQTQFVRHCEASRDDADKNLDAFRETSIVHLDAFLSSLRECVSTYNSERCSGIQHNLSRIAQDQTRLREVHSSFERLLHESDAFQFIKDYNSSMKRYQRWLRKPLFFPDEPTMDIEPLYEIMEGKMEEFIAETRQHSSTLISALFEFEGGDGEEVDDDDDEESDDDDDDDENESDAEGEDEMSEEEEEQHLTESEVEEYIPEEEDDDDDEED